MRFQDDGTCLDQLADQVLVRCPNCQKCGVVRADGPRLVCPHCALTRTASGSRSIWGVATDPWFGCDLWLIEAFRNHQVWAFNRRHAQLLLDYVSADQRSRQDLVDRSQPTSVVERLPTWFKAAGHRDDLVRVLTALVARAEAAI